MIPPCQSRCASANKMAAFLQWRKFVFFDRETVKDPVDNGKNFALPAGISVCDSGRGHIVLGDILIAALPNLARLAQVMLTVDAKWDLCLQNEAFSVAVFANISRLGLNRMCKLRVGQEVQARIHCWQRQ